MDQLTLSTGMRWLWNHRPDVMYVIIVAIFIIWMKGQFDDIAHRFEAFDRRLEKTEILCHNINDVQLPAIRQEMRETQKQNELRFDQLDKRLSRIEAFMIKMDTYLTVTAKDYPKGDPSKLLNP